jgi:hypothetical protein
MHGPLNVKHSGRIMKSAWQNDVFVLLILSNNARWILTVSVS